jgi:hypothetical protein
MTEGQWDACTDAAVMVEYLRARGTASERKFRLFATACCRRVWSQVSDVGCQAAVEAAEVFADDPGGLPLLEATLDAAWRATRIDTPSKMAVVNAAASRIHPALGAWGAAVSAAGSVAGTELARITAVSRGYTAHDIALAWAEGHPDQAANWSSHVAAVYDAGDDPAWSHESEAQVALTRDIFGNPFRPIPSLSPSLLGWENGLAVRLAEVAYDHRSLPSGHLDDARLAVLADALEDAGCTDALLLTHLRGDGHHVRGCWAIDAVLGKSKGASGSE